MFFNMLVLWKERLAFLAVPKTGSSAIEAALAPHAALIFQGPPQIKHMTHQRFNRFIRPYLKKEGVEEVEKIAVMRHPVDWLGSWYRYRARPALDGLPNSTKDISFDSFVTAYLMEEDRPAYARLGSQVRQLSVSRSEIGMDHIFPYEDLDRLLDFLKSRMGHAISLEAVNRSPSMEMSLSKGIRARLEKRYALDFETHAALF